MSRDLITAIGGFLSNGWRFFTEVTIPTTDITIAQLSIAIVFISVSLGFIGLMVGIPFHPPSVDEGYGNPKSTSLIISDKRYLDVR